MRAPLTRRPAQARVDAEFALPGDERGEWDEGSLEAEARPKTKASPEAYRPTYLRV